MKPLVLLALLTALASITVPAGAFASPRTEKVYAANGRRVAVIKNTAFGRKMYGENGRRVATIKGRRSLALTGSGGGQPSEGLSLRHR